MKMEDYRALPIWVQATVDFAGLGRGSGGVTQIMRIEFDDHPKAVRVKLRPQARRVAIEIIRKGD